MVATFLCVFRLENLRWTPRLTITLDPSQEDGRHVTPTEPKKKWLRQFSKQESIVNMENLAQTQVVFDEEEDRLLELVWLDIAWENLHH